MFLFLPTYLKAVDEALSTNNAILCLIDIFGLQLVHNRL
jgi:hypothetical protein